MSTRQLLRAAFPLIRTHGFTRKTLSVAALSLPRPSEHPLSDTAINALFGEGEEAPRTLLNAWLVEGRRNMEGSEDKSVGGLLKYRLRWNEPVLQFLPEVCREFPAVNRERTSSNLASLEAFAMMMTSSSILPIDAAHAIQHAGSIADQACYLSGDKSTGVSPELRSLPDYPR